MKKETNILELFFNEPTRQWHFEEILKMAKISRPQAVHWLRKCKKENLIRRIKPKGKQPYYIAHYEHPQYQIKKRLFALTMLENVGFLSHLSSLAQVKTVVLFGSMSRWDWYAQSDVDIFIQGDPKGLQIHKYRVALHREIELFLCKDERDLKQFNPALLQNVAEGYFIKGKLNFMGATT